MTENPCQRTRDGTAGWKSPRVGFLTLQKDQNSCQEARNILTVVLSSPTNYPEPSDKCPLATMSSYLGDIKKTRMVTWSLLTSGSVCLVTFSLAQHLLNNQQMVQKMRRPAPNLALRAGLACDCQRDRAAYSKGTSGKISI